jgi:hypothetical protein
LPKEDFEQLFFLLSRAIVNKKIYSSLKVGLYLSVFIFLYCPPIS